MVEQSGTTDDWQTIWEQYKTLSTPRSNMEIHIVAGSIKFNHIEQSKNTLF